MRCVRTATMEELDREIRRQSERVDVARKRLVVAEEWLDVMVTHRESRYQAQREGQ
jgi:hypothetical protein